MPHLTCDSCDRTILQVLRTAEVAPDLHAVLCPACYVDLSPSGRWDRFEWLHGSQTWALTIPVP